MATKSRKPAAPASKRSGVDAFIISRTFDAPRPAVVKAWTDEKELMKWWGPKGAKMLTAKLDLQPGGLFHYSMQTADFTLWGKWTIQDVALPDKLVFLNSFSDPEGGTTIHPMAPDWPLELLTTVLFTEKAGKTTVTIRWEPRDATEAQEKAFAAAHESMQGGWGGSLEVLADVLTKATDTPAPQAVIPHLTIKGADKAVAFYKKVFGAEEVSRMPAEDGKRIMHCVLTINGGTLFIADDFPEHGGPTAPQDGTRSPVALAVNMSAPGTVDATFAAAIKAGAKSIMEPADQFWGARFAMLTDPFGHRWMLNAELAKA